MRPDLNQIESEITPLLTVHGVELVALEWFRGPGHGILRVTIDLPNGDPHCQDPDRSVSLAAVSDVTRDISTAMDALDLIEDAYTLEVGSPGPERPVQKRADFDRFGGMRVRLSVRKGGAEGKASLNGILRGTVDLPDTTSFAVRVEVQDKFYEIPASHLARAHLCEVVAERKPKPGKGPSRRQERLAARERARAVNAEHLIAKWSAPSDENADAQRARTPGTPESPAHDPDDSHSPTTALRPGQVTPAEQAYKATR